MREKYNDICSSIVFILFAIFMFVTSYSIQPTTSDILGSRFFPRLVAGVIALLALIQMINAYTAIRKQPEARGESEKTGKGGYSLPLILTVIALFAYYVLILQIGFVITSILYLTFQSAVLMSKDDLRNKKRVLMVVLVSIIAPIFIKSIFWNVFSIALPAGKVF